jgi:hypothetical protein
MTEEAGRMSLPAGQLRKLAGIEVGLRASEPRLEAKFAMFTRLVADEDPPVREQVLGAWQRFARTTRAAVVLPVMAFVMIVTGAIVSGTAQGSARCATRTTQSVTRSIAVRTVCIPQARQTASQTASQTARATARQTTRATARQTARATARQAGRQTVGHSARPTSASAARATKDVRNGGIPVDGASRLRSG